MTKHYLISIDITADVRMHSYLAVDDDRYIDATVNRMFELAENMKLRPFPVVLVTHLSTGVDIVRKMLRKEDPEFARCRVKMADSKSRCTIWLMGKEHPDDAALMKLH